VLALLLLVVVLMAAKSSVWNLESIEKACRKEMERTKIGPEAPKNFNHSANAVWISGGSMWITIDRLTVCELRAVLHELIHRVLYKELSVFRDYVPKSEPPKRDAQEVIIESLEDALFDRIKVNQKATKWWRDKIVEKAR